MKEKYQEKVYCTPFVLILIKQCNRRANFFYCIVHEKLRFVMMEDEVRCYETKLYRKNQTVKSQSFTPQSKSSFLPFLCCQQSMISYISETKHLNLIFVQLDELYDPSNTKYYKELNHRTIISKTLGP